MHSYNSHNRAVILDIEKLDVSPFFTKVLEKIVDYSYNLIKFYRTYLKTMLRVRISFNEMKGERHTDNIHLDKQSRVSGSVDIQYQKV